MILPLEDHQLFILETLLEKSKGPFTLAIQAPKPMPVENEEGLLTPFGMELAHRYASKWIQSQTRDLDMERMYPQLAGLFHDIRVDSELAERHAS